MEKKKADLNVPFIVITGFGIFVTLFLVYFFVYNKAIDTVREDLTIQKAYPNIKPQEFITELQFISKEYGFSVYQIYSKNSTFLLNINSEKELNDLDGFSPSALVYTNVTIALYDLGNGTAIVGTNPYIWDIIFEDKNLDQKAENYSKTINSMLDKVYLSIKQKKKAI